MRSSVTLAMLLAATTTAASAQETPSLCASLYTLPLKAGVQQQYNVVVGDCIALDTTTLAQANASEHHNLQLQYRGAFAPLGQRPLTADNLAAHLPCNQLGFGSVRLVKDDPRTGEQTVVSECWVNITLPPQHLVAWPDGEDSTLSVEQYGAAAFAQASSPTLAYIRYEVLDTTLAVVTLLDGDNGGPLVIGLAPGTTTLRATAQGGGLIDSHVDRELRIVAPTLDNTEENAPQPPTTAEAADTSAVASAPELRALPLEGTAALTPASEGNGDTSPATQGPAYDLAGRLLTPTFHGLAVKDGKLIRK